MRDIEQVRKYLDQFSKIVGLYSAYLEFNDYTRPLEGIDVDIYNEKIEALNRLAERYNVDIDFKEPMDDFRIGYYHGLYDALKWIVGEDVDFSI